MTKQSINKTQSFKLIQENAGKFLTVTFIKEDKSTRVMNGQYKKRETNALGYVLIRETKTGIEKNVNLQTLKEIKVNKQIYKVK